MMLSKRGFKPEQYLSLSQDHLVVTALAFLIDDKQQTSFENLVAEAFLSFPERFQLEGYSDWPNAHVVGKAWVRCRTDKKWITGAAAQGFKLTPLGQQIAEGVREALSVKAGSKQSHRKGSRQTISSRVVLRIEASNAFETYKANGIASVSEFDFCDLLYCTLGSSPEVLEKNFMVIRQEVETYGREDLVVFLEKLQERFSAKFGGKKARGGLMPQKKEA